MKIWYISIVNTADIQNSFPSIFIDSRFFRVIGKLYSKSTTSVLESPGFFEISAARAPLINAVAVEVPLNETNPSSSHAANTPTPGAEYQRPHHNLQMKTVCRWHRLR